MGRWLILLEGKSLLRLPAPEGATPRRVAPLLSGWAHARGLSVIDTLEHLPVLAVEADSVPARGESGVQHAAPLLSQPWRCGPIAGRHPLAAVEPGVPREGALAGLRVASAGTHIALGHPTAVWQAIGRDGLHVGLPPRSGPWNWLAGIDAALGAGARVLNLSAGWPTARAERGWILLGPALAFAREHAGLLTVAAAGSSSRAHPRDRAVYLPARHPAVLGVSAMVGGTPYPLNCQSPRGNIHLCHEGGDPRGAAPGTSFACGRVSALAEHARQGLDASCTRPEGPELILAALLAAARSQPDPRGPMQSSAWAGQSLGAGRPSRRGLDAVLKYGGHAVGHAPGRRIARSQGRLRVALAWRPDRISRECPAPAGGRWRGMSLQLHAGDERVDGVGGVGWRVAEIDARGAVDIVVEGTEGTWALAWRPASGEGPTFP